jgi:hypothetical protein
LNMTYVSADDLHTNAQTSYEFGFNTINTGIASTGAVWIDWPNDYIPLFIKNYGCSFKNTELTGSASCDFQDQTGRKRTSITGFTNAIPAKSNEIKIGFSDVPTLQSSGESPEFTIRTYDSVTKAVVERSYPSTSIIDTLTFVQGQS